MSLTSPHLTPQTSSFAPASAQTVGQMLLQGRTALGLSLADVATVTRIPRNMLAHLERDRFDEYRASVFVRGHLVNYARELHLDVDAVIAAYDRQRGVVKPVATPEANSASLKPSKPTSITAKLEAVRNLAPKKEASTKDAPKSAPASKRLNALSGSIQPIHMVAALLVVFALVTCVFFLGHSQDATAQNPNSFRAAPAPTKEWGHEKDVNQARWFLEQGSAATKP